jgi:hypothetical protein
MNNAISLVEVEIPKDKKGQSRIVDVGDTITIRTIIKDDVSGVKSVSISFKNPSGSRTQHVVLHPRKSTNVWEANYLVQPTDENGVYKDFFINMADNAGNQTYGWELLSDFKDKMIFTVNNSSGGDIKAPKVEDIEVTPKLVGVGDILNIKVNVEDDLSGVRNVSVSFKNPSGSRTQHVMLKCDYSSNMWIGKYKVSPWDEDGVYREFFINVTDNAGNQAYGWNLSDSFKDKMIFTIENKVGGDINPPKILNAEVTPKLVNVGESISFKVEASDDISGVKTIAISFKNPSGSRVQYIPLHFDETTKKWIGNYTARFTDEGGIYDDFFINMTDKAQNQTYGWNLSNAFKGKMIFTISNNGGDTLPPEIKNIKITTNGNK